MKSILYIIALVTIAASAFFTSKNIAPHQEELAQTKDLKAQNINLKTKIDALVDDISKQKDEKVAKEDEKNELVSKINLIKTKVVQSKKESNGLNASLDTLKEEKAEIDDVVGAVKKAVGGLGVTIDQVPAFYDKIEEEKKQLNQKHISVQAEVERYTTDVGEKKGEVAALLSAEQQRRKNLKANGVSSLITSVDNDWGFVIVKPHSDAIIKQDSQLIVVRGTNHVGRLTINAIENGRVLANIDYKSLASGMRIRSGDRVILAKGVTR